MPKDALVFADWKGKTGIRCQDGDYRRRPWFGTYGECVQFFTARGAKRVVTNLHNRVGSPGKTLIIFNVERVSHSNRGIEVECKDNRVYLVRDGMNYTVEYPEVS
jgi:hypothetical protein